MTREVIQIETSISFDNEFLHKYIFTPRNLQVIFEIVVL
jgi:hypothetical protein